MKYNIYLKELDENVEAEVVNVPPGTFCTYQTVEKYLTFDFPLYALMFKTKSEYGSDNVRMIPLRTVDEGYLVPECGVDTISGELAPFVFLRILPDYMTDRDLGAKEAAYEIISLFRHKGVFIGKSTLDLADHIRAGLIGYLAKQPGARYKPLLEEIRDLDKKTSGEKEWD